MAGHKGIFNHTPFRPFKEFGDSVANGPMALD
jgi:hypothetical protein